MRKDWPPLRAKGHAPAGPSPSCPHPARPAAAPEFALRHLPHHCFHAPHAWTQTFYKVHPHRLVNHSVLHVSYPLTNFRFHRLAFSAGQELQRRAGTLPAIKCTAAAIPLPDPERSYWKVTAMFSLVYKAQPRLGGRKTCSLNLRSSAQKGKYLPIHGNRASYGPIRSEEIVLAC